MEGTREPGAASTNSRVRGINESPGKPKACSIHSSQGMSKRSLCLASSMPTSQAEITLTRRNDCSPAFSMSCTASGLTPVLPSISHTQTWVSSRTGLSTFGAPFLARRAHNVAFLHHVPGKEAEQAHWLLLFQWDEPSHRLAAFGDGDDLALQPHFVQQGQATSLELPCGMVLPFMTMDM